MKVSETLHEAYINALKDVWTNPDFHVSPRGQGTREILDYSFRVLSPVAEPIVTNDPERNQTIASYTAKEVELYDSRTNRVEDFERASKFWKKLANPDGTVNSAYGYLIWSKKSCGDGGYEYGESMWGEECLRTPWEWAKLSLINDKDTRQALLKFNLPEHAWVGNKDFPCTLDGLFTIRNDKLYFSVDMRSNDLMRGLVYDMPWFISLMDRMIEELKPHYPNLTKGWYTHRARSMHIYDRDEETILKMIGE